MELIALWIMLRRRWWLVLLPLGVVLLLSLPGIPEFIDPPEHYQVTMRFTAAAPPDAGLELDDTYEDSVYVPWLASEYVVVNFPHWVTSDSFAREISAELERNDMQIDAEAVRSAFAADSARSILIVYVSWDDSEETQAIAQAAATVLQTRNQDYFPQFAAYPARVIALDDVRVTVALPSLITRFGLLLRLLVALGTGIGLATIAEYLDETVHTVEDVRVLGIGVLGAIPGK